MDASIASTIIGGIGLFLLGMFLMTNGLRLAAGQALRRILESSTRTTLRGIFAGITITSLVQSSSAVTVATLGFVNAGLIHLKQAITVIYGSNIGTTMTAWLVALIGFNVNIKAFALPAIGIGMLLRLIGQDRRYGAWGEALAGFGVFFLGIEILKTGFEGMGSSIQFSGIEPAGTGLLILVGSGFTITLLMQSSSAAMAIILSATAGGVIALPTAAALVIGANIGTTSTALLAVIGATPNAKRVAAAHVIFNLITGAIALMILPWMLALINKIEEQFSLLRGLPSILALFHTTFNVLGVLLLWPFTDKLVQFLRKRFRSAEEDEARPQYIDHTLAATPLLAFHALSMELGRIADISRRMAKGAISTEIGPGHSLETDKSALERLSITAGEFSAKIQKADLPAELAEALPNGLRILRYYTTIGQLAQTVATLQPQHSDIAYAPIAKEVNNFKRSVVHLIENADSSTEGYSSQENREALEEIEKRYQNLKSSLLRNGAEGHISVQEMVSLLELMSHIRRLAQQIEKGARYLDEFKSYEPATPLEEAELQEGSHNN